MSKTAYSKLTTCVRHVAPCTYSQQQGTSYSDQNASSASRRRLRDQSTEFDLLKSGYIPSLGGNYYYPWNLADLS
jgi:hypothetical protein